MRRTDLKGKPKTPGKRLDGLHRRLDFSGHIVLRKADDDPLTPEQIEAVEDPQTGWLRLRGRINDFVTSENIREIQCGTVGKVWFEPSDGYTYADILVTDPDAIAAIKAGKCQLSCGYWCELEEAVGSLDGKPYKYRQIGIVGNHVAGVDRARGGPACRYVFDGAAVRVRPSSILNGDSKVKKINKKNAKDATIEIEGAQVEIPDAVAKMLADLQAKVEEQGAELAKLQGEGDEDPVIEEEELPMDEEAPVEEEPAAKVAGKDSKAIAKLQATVDALTAQRKADAREYASKIDARVNLVTKAREILGSGVKVDGHSDSAIQRAVVTKVMPNMASRVKSSKDAAYIAGLYEAALEVHAEKADSSGDLMSLVGHATMHGDESKVDIDDVFSKFQSKISSAGKRSH
jgi:hypothetical protein